MFDIKETELRGVQIVTPRCFEDNRGHFIVPYNEDAFVKAGIDNKFIQDNHSHSKANVFRGFHFQSPYPQAKLVRCTRGKVIDIVIDIREGSPHFGKSVAVELSAENNQMLMVPRDFAHGFYVIEGPADFMYKVDNIYYPDGNYTLLWNDPDIEFDMDEMTGGQTPILSEQDGQGMTLQQLKDAGALPQYAE